MPKAGKKNNGTKSKLYAMPAAQRKKDFGVPKFQISKAGKQAMPAGSKRPATTTALSALAADIDIPEAGPSSGIVFEPVDAALTTRDSSSKAFMRELRKVIDRSDVIIQVLDARDPDGTRSRWVEEEVRKREADGKKLLAVVNKIDLVPRANLEAWLKHLRHYFPCMPFKSSTQSQRQNLSQNTVPLAQPTNKPGEKATYTELPQTSSSLGAPALLHLLKQYALSTPHSSLTVGVVGYPNVGKSSLINSLKRSRACAVAAMPGKTRVVQEVVLDKGVKIIDCPGVVLEDFGRAMEGEEGRKRQAEIMLRNCIKAELVEDPISPVEVILSKVDTGFLQRLYSIPPFDNVRDFLIRIALTRGRLGKGGIPDLEGSAVSVLRDWNSGKIPYYTVPPQIHPSAIAAKSAVSTGDVQMGGEVPEGDKVLNTLSAAFTLDGLFDNDGETAEWNGNSREPAENDMLEEDVQIPTTTTVPVEEGLSTRQVASTMMMDSASSDESDSGSEDAEDDEDDDFGFRPPAIATARNPLVPSTALSSQSFGFPEASASTSSSRPNLNPTRLFTADELSALPSGILDRQKAKQAAKKAKKRQAEKERTEGELMYGLLGMEVDVNAGPKVEMVVGDRKNKKERRREKRKAELEARRMAGEVWSAPKPMVDQGVGQVGRSKEEEFERFLSGMGADMDEDL